MQCPKCTNDMATSALVTPLGAQVMVAGTIATGPRPLSAQVCTACGYTELYAAQWTEELREARAAHEEPQVESALAPAPALPDAA